MKRTKVDFTGHSLYTRVMTDPSYSGEIRLYLLTLGSQYHMVQFMVGESVTVVTGDFGTWVFSKEFHPRATGIVSDSYWKEKLRGVSDQKGTYYDQDATLKEINALMSPEYQECFGRNWSDEELEYLKSCAENTDSELDYLSAAYSYPRPGWFTDAENIPFAESTKPWLLAVFDAFEEICSRL